MRKTVRPSVILGLLLISWAIGIHITFLGSMPDPVFQPDSVGYASPALHSLNGGRFDLPIDRSPAYPMFLYAVLWFTHGFFGVLVVQHGMVLLTGLGAAWAYYRFVRPSFLGSAVVFFGTSALPVAVIYSHSILTETLYTFFLVGALLLLLYAGEKQRNLLWYGAGILVSLAVLTRPVGIAWLGVLGIAGVAAGLSHDSGAGWLRAGLTAIMVLVAVSLWNLVRRGFFGVDQMSGPALFCSTARYLDPEKIEDQTIRDVLRPVYDRSRDHLSDGAWVYGDPQGPVQRLSAIFPPRQLNKILAHLGLMAIQAHPFRFLIDRGRLFTDFLWRYSGLPPIYLNREFTFFLYRGLQLFGDMTVALPESRHLLRYGPAEAQAYFARLKPLASGRVSHPEDYLSQIDRQDVYHYENVLAWWYPLRMALRGMRWLPLLAILSAWLLWQQRQAPHVVGILLLIIGTHAAVSTMAAFQDPRFAAPLISLYWILMVGGIQVLADRYVPAL